LSACCASPHPMDVEQTYNKPKYRGKLYVLTEDLDWNDTGTGFVAISGPEESRRLVFRSEENGDVLHDRPVFSSDIYQLQGEGGKQTIIVWSDPESKQDWALSFQDPEGTSEIWDAISKEPGIPDEKRLLPLPKLGNLAEVSRMLCCVPPSQREVLAVECLTSKFLNSLRDTFHTAEDLGSEEALGFLWHIIKGIFLLSNQKLTERYLRQDVYDDILGMLEYDDGLPVDKRIAHRQVLKIKVRFNYVIAFEDSDTLDRIHLNYRLQYLKDVVLPRLLDDAAFVSLTQMIHANLSIILDHLHKNAVLLERLFAQIQQSDGQSLLFLQDACRLAKQIPPSERQSLYEKMVDRNLFDVLAPFFGEGCIEAESKLLRPRHVVVEVLLLSALNDASHLRRYITGDVSKGRTLLSAIIKLMLSEEDQGVQGQTAELLKLVMDPTSLESRERDACIEAFYDRGALDELIAPLRADAVKSESPSACFGQQLICELLAFAVVHHGFRAKTYVMRHGLAQQASRLLSSAQRFLQLAPVRLIRSIVSIKDESFHRYLCTNNIFTPLMREFQQSLQPPALGGNLLVSATLELLEFIRTENNKRLINHICKKHGDMLREHAPKFKTLEGLLLKHQQNLEYEAFPPDRHAAGGPIKRAGDSARSGRLRSPSSDDDEAYFEALDEDEDASHSASQRNVPQTTTNSEQNDQTITGSSPPKETSLDRQDPEAGEALKGLLGGYEEEEDTASIPVPPDSTVCNDPTRAVPVPHASPDADTDGDTVSTDADADPVACCDEVEAENTGNSSVAVKRSGAQDANENGKPEIDKAEVKSPCSPKACAVTERPATAKAKAGIKGTGEKSLNHVSKRLKTSPPASA